MTLPTAITEFLSLAAWKKPQPKPSSLPDRPASVAGPLLILQPTMTVDEVSKHDLPDYLTSTSSIKDKDHKAQDCSYQNLFKYLEF